MIEIVDQNFFRRIAIQAGSGLSPTGRLGLEYLAEGAANVIFVVRFLGPNSNLRLLDRSCVLRIGKNLPFVRPTKVAIEEFETRIAPIFGFDPSLLLPPAPLELSRDLVTTINVELGHLEELGDRPKMRHNVYLPPFAEEPYATIMKNLFHIPGRVVEFKPKWLVQSPSAPGNSQRCRTCALNAMRRCHGKEKGRGDSGFCPFDLLSTNITILTDALRPVWQDENTLTAFVKAFRETIQPKVRELQKLQREHNDLGLDSFEDPEGRDFSVAMALRDCSMFVKVELRDAGYNNDDEGAKGMRAAINVVKLLDLDLKDSGGGKLAKWAHMERSLIEEEWYTDTTKGDVKCAMNFQ